MYSCFLADNDFTCFVALLPVSHLPVSLPVLNFHMQLARFRQHKTKGQSSKAQKKTQKRKGEVVHKNDIPPEEDTLIPAECTDKDPVLGAEQVSTEVVSSCIVAFIMILGSW